MKIRFAGSAFAAALAASLALGIGMAPSVAETPAETVKKRQETMKQLGGHMKAIKTFLEGGAGSAADVGERAAAINGIAARIPTLFPEGTGMDEVMDPKNGAKPEIWLDWERFAAAAKGLEERSAALKTAAAGDDRGAIGAAFGEMGKNGCGACHKPFRVKLDK